jgi:hypothetical protein
MSAHESGPANDLKYRVDEVVFETVLGEVPGEIPAFVGMTKSSLLTQVVSLTLSTR